MDMEYLTEVQKEAVQDGKKVTRTYVNLHLNKLPVGEPVALTATQRQYWKQTKGIYGPSTLAYFKLADGRTVSAFVEHKWYGVGQGTSMYTQIEELENDETVTVTRTQREGKSGMAKGKMLNIYVVTPVSVATNAPAEGEDDAEPALTLEAVPSLKLTAQQEQLVGLVKGKEYTRDRLIRVLTSGAADGNGGRVSLTPAQAAHVADNAAEFGLTVKG